MTNFFYLKTKYIYIYWINLLRKEKNVPSGPQTFIGPFAF